MRHSAAVALAHDHVLAYDHVGSQIAACRHLCRGVDDSRGMDLLPLIIQPRPIGIALLDQRMGEANVIRD